MKIIKHVILIFLLLFIGKVSAETYVASIGNEQYLTLSDAISHAENGDEIILLSDVSSKTVIPDGKDIILNVPADYSISNIENNGKLLIKGKGTVKNNTFSNGIDNKGNLTVEGELTFKSSSTTTKSLINSNKAVINSATFAQEEGNFAQFIINNENADMTINGGNYSGHKVFNNEGKLTINGGTFEKVNNTTPNVNKGYLVINGGQFKSSQCNFIDNIRGTTDINNGTFNVLNVAENYDASYLSNTGKESIINVNGGTFNTTASAFSNASLSEYSTINIVGGTINSSTDDYIIAQYSSTKNNTINILGGTINAKKSKGILLYGKSKTTIGNNDGNVSTNIPLISIDAGQINGLGVPKISFYDGKIILKRKFEIEVDVPSGYYVKYDDNGDGTYTAYLVTDSKEETEQKQEINTEVKHQDMGVEKKEEQIVNVPNTMVKISYIILVILFIASGIVCLIFAIKKLKNNFRN